MKAKEVEYECIECGHKITYRYTGTQHTRGITCECGGMYEPEWSEGEK